MRTPRDYQVAAAAHLAKHHRCNLWAGMGTGKTGSTLLALAAMRDFFGEAGQTLVLAPKRVAQHTWPAELREWPTLRGLTVSAALGDAETRRAALKDNADIVTINYENLPWLVEFYGTKWPFRRVIADESTRLKGFRLAQGTKRARALGKVAHKKVDRWVNLTGTPRPNGLVDLWGQQWFVDAGTRLGLTFGAFERRWFHRVQKGDSPHAFSLEPFAHSQAEIEERLADVTLTIRAEDWLDLPPLVENVIEVELPASAAVHYRNLERKLYTLLANGEEITAANGAALSSKCMQLANGAVIMTEGSNAIVHDAKLEALDSVIEEANGMPVLVAYNFVADRERILARYPNAELLGNDPTVIDRWNEGRVPLLLAHPQSAGHGLNLQHGGNILAFFGLTWNLEHHDQIIERIGPTRQAQAGLNRGTFVHYLVAANTVDVLALERLRTKASAQSLFLRALGARLGG